jgi:hypothetical protein
VSRKIHVDKKGPYIVWDTRKWRPTGPTAHNKDEVVQCYWVNYSTKDQVRVFTHKILPPGTPQNPTKYNKHIPDNEETWTCTDPDKREKKRLMDGFKVLEIPATRGALSVVVAGDDGYNYGIFRKDPQGYKPHHAKDSTRGINVHLHANGKAGHVQMTWEDFDRFVEEVNAHRDEVKIAPIAAKLEEEIALDDQLQDYLQEKGLVPSDE